MDQKLKNLLQKVFNLTDTEFNETLTREDISNWDSLKHMDLVMSIEKEYNIVLEVQDILELKSFDSIIQVLKSKGVDFG